MRPVNHRTDAVRIARDILALNPVYMDTETTGLENMDMIVEVAVLDTDGSLLYESLVKPGRPINPGAARVHGITDLMVDLAPAWNQVWPEVSAVLSSRVVVMYNAAFDIRLLKQTCGLSAIAWKDPSARSFCAMELFAQYYGEWDRMRGNYRWQNLAAAGRYLGIPEPNAHRAKDDALLTKLVLEKIALG